MDITVRILNWEKHQRRDVKRPSWFAFDNRMVEDEKFDSFNGWEFKAWIYILSRASEKQSNEVSISFSAASKRSNIPIKDFKSAIEKLKYLGIVDVDVTDAARARNVDGTPQTNKHNKHNTPTDTATYVSAAALEELYLAHYPRKEGKTPGLRILAKTPLSELENLTLAFKNFAEIKKDSNPKFIPHFSTWAGQWRDWINPDPSLRRPSTDGEDRKLDPTGKFYL